MDVNRKELLEQLSALDFMLVDLQLYLDTHPYDRNALMQYNSVVMQANMMRQNYESLYGPLNSYRSNSRYSWQWINELWPWQNAFNFKLRGEE